MHNRTVKFKFQNDRSRNFGAVGGRSSPFPIDKAHRLYNSLLLPHKPWLLYFTLLVCQLPSDLCCMWSSCVVHKSVSSSDACCCNKCRLSDAVARSDTDIVCVESFDCFCHINTYEMLTPLYGTHELKLPQHGSAPMLNLVNDKMSFLSSFKLRYTYNTIIC